MILKKTCCFFYLNIPLLCLLYDLAFLKMKTRIFYIYLSVCPWFCLLQEEAGDDAEERVVEDDGDHEAAAHRGQGRPCEGRHQLTLYTKRIFVVVVVVVVVYAIRNLPHLRKVRK
jgi:hypothetical protein